MKSEILIEIEKNCKEIEKLIDKQLFTIEDAFKFLKRYGNFALKINELTLSRDNWKRKYLRLKDEKK